MPDPNYMFTSPEEMIERVAAERGCAVQARYDVARKLWYMMVPKPDGWYAIAGTEDRTLLGSATRMWQMWMNRTKITRSG